MHQETDPRHLPLIVQSDWLSQTLACGLSGKSAKVSRDGMIFVLQNSLSWHLLLFGDRPVWKPVKQPPRAVERRAKGMLLATKLFMAGRATPSPSPTMPLASMTAGSVNPAAATYSNGSNA